MRTVAVAVVFSALDQPPTYLSRLFSPENLPTIALVVVGFLTLLAIWYQAKETAKATRAMRDGLPLQKSAAEAALKNAQAVINAERPWMIIELVPPTPAMPREGYLVFQAWNRGRTPAEIMDYQGDFFYHGIDEGFVAEPTFKPWERLYREYISPGTPLEVYSFSLSGSLPPDQWEWMHKERKRLYFKGRIVYRDLITYEEHESRFCYWLSPSPGVGLLMGGDRNWNKYT